MSYKAGDKVKALTWDNGTCLKPGTVAQRDDAARSFAVVWDDGSGQATYTDDNARDYVLPADWGMR